MFEATSKDDKTSAFAQEHQIGTQKINLRAETQCASDFHSYNRRPTNQYETTALQHKQPTTSETSISYQETLNEGLKTENAAVYATNISRHENVAKESATISETGVPGTNKAKVQQLQASVQATPNQDKSSKYKLLRFKLSSPANSWKSKDVDDALVCAFLEGNRPLQNRLCAGKGTKADRFITNVIADPAAFSRKIDILKSIANDGPGSSWMSEATALHMAIYADDIRGCTVLLDHEANVNARANKWTPLQLAVVMNRCEITLLLLKLGADVNATKSPHNMSPLYGACENGDETIVKALLDHGGDTEIFTDARNTPLNVAVMKDHAGVVKILLEHGANPNTQRNTGWTPLHSAAKTGNKAIMQNLLKHGAVISPLKDGLLPLHVAASNGHDDCVCLLLVAGVDVNAKDDGGFTSLHSAADRGRAETIFLLLAHGADVNAKVDGQYTALYIAVTREEVAATRALLKSKDIDVNSTNDRGYSALHAAAQSGNEEIVNMLMMNGANASVRNGDGDTPMDLAIRNNNQTIIRVIRDRGL